MADPDAIDIDRRPYVVAELQGRVVEEDDGRGRLVPFDASRWRAELKRAVGQVVRILIYREARRRTIPQCRYLWGSAYRDVLAGLERIAREAGDAPPFATVDDLHEAMKWKFLRKLKVLPGGEEIETVGSSATLTTVEFIDYIESISAWAAGYGIYVQQPNEHWEAA